MKTTTKAVKVTKPVKIKESFNCHVPIGMAHVNKGDVYIKPNKVYTLILTYPFAGEKHEFPIKSGAKGLRANDLTGIICKIYVDKIYKDDRSMDRYGVSGHGIDDLTLGGVDVNHKTKTIKIHVGS